MQPVEVVKRLAVVAAVVLVVVAGGVVATGGGSSETPAVDSLSVPAYAGEDAVASASEETGDVAVSANASGDVVLIDASHGASLDWEQLTPVVQGLSDAGAEVRFLTGQGGARGGPGTGSPFNTSLRKADALIIAGAEQQYTQAQVNGSEAFESAGGRVLVVTEPPRMQVSLLILGPRQEQRSDPMPLTPLLSRFGMSVGNGYFYNMHKYDLNYRNVYATPSTSSNLADGVDRLVLHESTPVRGPNSLVRTTDRTELSETRQQDRYSVVARSGNVVTVGDSSILDQSFYRTADNEVFVSNLLDFLISGDKEPENAPSPPETAEDEGSEQRPQQPPRETPPRTPPA